MLGGIEEGGQLWHTPLRPFVAFVGDLTPVAGQSGCLMPRALNALLQTV